MNRVSIDLKTIARTLNKQTPVPQYYQIAQGLRTAIEATDTSVGDVPLASEAELCSAFGVTRGTVRQALGVLEHQGLIYRQRGRGTFIRGSRPSIDVTHLASTAADLRAAGVVPGFRVEGVQQLVPPAYVAEALGLAPDETAWHIRRIRIADNEPVSLQSCWVIAEMTPQLDQKPLDDTLIAVLREHYGIIYDHAKRTIHARSATIEEAEALGLARGAAVFAISGPSFDADGAPIDFVESVWRGDRYDFTVRLSFSE